MIKLLLRDVGDGLNLIINNSNYHDLTVDFGGDENINRHSYFYGNFLLTHFHADHYNGILECNRRNSVWDLDNFYHPAMPSFTESPKFFMYLLSMNIRISDNHPIQNTILDFVRKQNSKKIKFRAVSKGDIIVCGNRKYEILWPPKELTEEEALTDIRNAIKDFEEARESDSILGEIYNRVSKNYDNTDINSVKTNEQNDQLLLTEFEGELSEVVKKANTSLRKAANRLSIAFRQEDNILFLGDLESREINSIVNDLVRNHNVVYDILITAHHGTHWGKNLTSITADICLASIGKTLQTYIKYEYKGIANKLLRTDEWGDIRITKRNRVK